MARSLVYVRCGEPRTGPIELIVANPDSGSMVTVPVSDDAAMSLVADLAGFLAARKRVEPAPPTK